MSYQSIAQEVLKNVGGSENVKNLGHCSTRLRFTLKDDTKADEEKIKHIKGIVGCVNKGGQFQVIVGNDVTFVYNELLPLLNSDKIVGVLPDDEVKKPILTRVLDIISGSMFPIVPAIAGGGMIKALLAILATFGLITKSTSTYQVLNFMGDAPFYFLPVLLGVSASKKFNVNPYIGGSLGAMLISPTFTSMVAAAKEVKTAITLFGINIPFVNYASSVVPIFINLVVVFC